ncbi:helix-turn-helix domain-containing protein [Azospirillum argentinense]
MSGLTLLVIKEVRLERGIQSAYLAEQVHKSPSAWAKIENGKSTFSMDSLFLAARALWIQPSMIISAVERYATFLGQNGWAVVHNSLSSEDDNLLIEAQRYYESPGFKRRIQPTFGQPVYNGFGVSVLNSPVFFHDGSIRFVDVFRFIVDERFRAEQERELSVPISPYGQA